MNNMVIKEFFEEDYDPVTQQILIETIEKYSGQAVFRVFTFNRFNVRLNFEDSCVLIEDELMVGKEGECEINLHEFEMQLRNINKY